MGWMKRRGLMWGDEPQDVMDNVLEKKFGKGWYNKKIPLSVAKPKVMQILNNKSLRNDIDIIYKETWGRKARIAEYRDLIWGISSINNGKHYK